MGASNLMKTPIYTSSLWCRFSQSSQFNGFNRIRSEQRPQNDEYFLWGNDKLCEDLSVLLIVSILLERPSEHRAQVLFSCESLADCRDFLQRIFHLSCSARLWSAFPARWRLGLHRTSHHPLSQHTSSLRVAVWSNDDLSEIRRDRPSFAKPIAGQHRLRKASQETLH